MARVFISHVRADRAPARRLAELLRQSGYEPWLADDEARVGEPVTETLAHELRDTRIAVVLLSKASVESAWTSTEVALLRRHAPELLRLYGVRLERTTPPEELSGERIIDLFPGEDAWQSGAKRLLHVLGTAGTDLPGDKPVSLPPNNLPPRAVPFVGREQDLFALHERLMTMPVGSSVLVMGPRGRGKTALATEYALRYAADFPGGIWWVPAHLGPTCALAWLLEDLVYSNVPSMDEQVFGIALDASTEDLARGALRALESTHEPSLLILDDLTGAEWNHFVPSGHVRVLATSRSRRLAGMNCLHVHSLDALSPEEVQSLLLQETSHEVPRPWEFPHHEFLLQRLRERPLLASLVSRLGQHPGASWSRIEGAVHNLMRQEARADTRGRTSDLENAVIDTCIEQFPPGSLARRLLEATAFFAPAIEMNARLAWTAAIHEGLHEGAPLEEVRRALDALAGSGLLQVWTNILPVCRAHRPIQQRIRVLAPKAHWERVTRMALASARDGAQEAEAHGDWLLERMRPHLEAVLRKTVHLTDSRDWVETADLLATHLSRRGEHLPARSLWEQTLRRAEKEADAEVDLTGDLRAKLASAHEALGDMRTALGLLERSVEDDASTTHGDVTRKAHRLADLALLQHTVDAQEAALESIDRALRLDREALAESDPDFPMRLLLRGKILRLMQRDEEAHAVLEEALAAGERLIAGNPLALVPIMEALAESRRNHHDEKGALTLLERAIEEDRRELGDEHYETLFHLTELARTYAEFERRQQTRATVERVLALLDKTLPSTDTRRETLLLKLAESLQMIGDQEKGHRLLASALDVEAAQAEPDFGRLSAVVTMALFQSGQSNDIPLLERAASLAQRASGQSPTAESFSKFLLHVLDTTAPAEPVTPLSPIQTPSPGAGAESLERALRLARRSQVRDELKAEALREALTAAQQGDDLANGARASLLLADLEGRGGAWEQAREHARQGLQLALRAELPPLVAEGYRVLGDTALHGSFYEEARMSYEEAIRRYDGLGEVGPAARTRTLLVTLLMQLGHLDGLEDHVRWLGEHQQHPSLSEEDRKDIREVLSLAGARLSSPPPGARDPRS